MLNHDKAGIRSACVLAAACLLALTSPAFALRFMTWNLLNYPGTNGPSRAPDYQTVLAPLSADVLVTEEMTTPTANTEFLNEVLNVIEPGQWATAPFIDGNDTDACLFYKPAKVQYLGEWAYYPDPSYHLRFVHVYRLKPMGYNATTAEFRIYAAHLKADQGYESDRLAECAGIRDSTNALPAGVHALVCGDMNFYTTEAGYVRLTESENNNAGRCFDMLPAGVWHDGPQFAHIHTQSTCGGTNCPPGAATGGLDDRFDFTLPIYNTATGQGLSVITGTNIPVGNDGLHFDVGITNPPTLPEGAAYANALLQSSDHLPIRVDLQVPALISTASAIAFGSVIVGAPQQQMNLSVRDVAAPPADSLRCTLAPPPGFGAPATLAVAAGDSAAAVITMGAQTVGAQGGNLVITSNDAEHPTTSVALSGTVLAHAVASLDSLRIVRADTIDFGVHNPGGFSDQTAIVFNQGYNPLQARLSVTGGTITGGSGRFTFVGGFTPGLVSGVGARYGIHFDDGGANPDSVYQAVVTFSSADEPLPGAQPQPDLQVTVKARVQNPAGSHNPALPKVNRLYEPVPNPSSGSVRLRLDLAQTAPTTLAIFDVAGRQLTLLRSGTLSAGHYEVAWSGMSDAGKSVSSGTYFVRLTIAGKRTQSVRFTVAR